MVGGLKKMITKPTKSNLILGVPVSVKPELIAAHGIHLSLMPSDREAELSKWSSPLCPSELAYQTPVPIWDGIDEISIG